MTAQGRAILLMAIGNTTLNLALLLEKPVAITKIKMGSIMNLKDIDDALSDMSFRMQSEGSSVEFDVVMELIDANTSLVEIVRAQGEQIKALEEKLNGST